MDSQKKWSRVILSEMLSPRSIIYYRSVMNRFSEERNAFSHQVVERAYEIYFYHPSLKLINISHLVCEVIKGERLYDEIGELPVNPGAFYDNQERYECVWSCLDVLYIHALLGKVLLKDEVGFRLSTMNDFELKEFERKGTWKIERSC